MDTLVYVSGGALPDAQLIVRNGDLTYPDFSSGYTFTLKVAPVGSSTATFTKTTGITGAAGSATAPNVLVAWATSGEIGSLAAGYYTLQLDITRTSDSKPWRLLKPVEILPSIS